jgi:mono/diheme cytochrome c family protein
MLKSIGLFVCAAALLPLAASASTPGAGAFQAKCAMCHGQNGAGDTPLGKRMQVRDLRSAAVQAQSTEALTIIVAKGQKAMPGFGKSLDSEQIKDLVGFVRSIAAK